MNDPLKILFGKLSTCFFNEYRPIPNIKTNSEINKDGRDYISSLPSLFSSVSQSSDNLNKICNILTIAEKACIDSFVQDRCTGVIASLIIQETESEKNSISKHELHSFMSSLSDHFLFQYEAEELNSLAIVFNAASKKALFKDKEMSLDQFWNVESNADIIDIDTWFGIQADKNSQCGNKFIESMTQYYRKGNMVSIENIKIITSYLTGMNKQDRWKTQARPALDYVLGFLTKKNETML